MSFELPDGKLYDLTMIREIAHGNNDFVKKMMMLFIDTMPPALAEMKQHLADHNWANLGAVAHKIKPSIDTMGIDLLKEDIRSIEKSGKEMINLDAVPALMEKLDAVINRIFDQLREEIATM